MDEQRLILVVEDDDATRSFLVENFAADGFRAVGASSAGEGIRAIEVRRPSLVLLDLALESSSGLELLGRVRAVLRRAEGRRRQGLLRVGELTVDPSTRSVRLGGKKVELAAKEFALLHALAEEPTRVYGKNELLRDVWGGFSPGTKPGRAVTRGRSHGYIALNRTADRILSKQSQSRAKA